MFLLISSKLPLISFYVYRKSLNSKISNDIKDMLHTSIEFKTVSGPSKVCSFGPWDLLKTVNRALLRRLGCEYCNKKEGWNYMK
jgi:hypothetical protein